MRPSMVAIPRGRELNYLPRRYERLSDAADKLRDDRFRGGPVGVWFCRPEFINDMATLPGRRTRVITRATLGTTHVHLGKAYAEAHGANALPASPLVVAAYLAHLDAEGLGASTIDVALASIVDGHRAAGLDPPTSDPRVRDVRAGLRALRGTRPRAKAPLSPHELHEMIDALPPDLGGARDRAVLLVGFGSALRRSELVALLVEDLTFHRRGVVVLVRRAKTDQEGAGVEVPIHAAGGPLCPVAALRDWLDQARIERGPVFRGVTRWGKVGSGALSARFVAAIVQRAAARVGLEPRELGGHSLRAGFATTAASRGAHLAEIGAITRHASVEMVARYVRRGTLFEADPLRGALAR